jgi:hypothetical protein
MPTGPTPEPGSNDDKLATTAFVMREIEHHIAGVASFNHRTGHVELELQDIFDAGGAPIHSPHFTGEPEADTPPFYDDSRRLATTEFVQRAFIELREDVVTSWNNRRGDVELTLFDVTYVGGAPILDPMFQGIPRAPTPPEFNNSTRIATTAFVRTDVDREIDALRRELEDELDELERRPYVESFNQRTGRVELRWSDVSAVGGAPIESPSFLGKPRAPTPPPQDDSTRLATTRYVDAAIASNHGPPGPPGPQGAMGVGFNFRGTVATAYQLPNNANVGDVWIVEETDESWYWNGSHWVSMGFLPPGPQGEIGPVGPTGPVGPPGAAAFTSTYLPSDGGVSYLTNAFNFYGTGAPGNTLWVLPSNPYEGQFMRLVCFNIVPGSVFRVESYDVNNMRILVRGSYIETSGKSFGPYNLNSSVMLDIIRNQGTWWLTNIAPFNTDTSGTVPQPGTATTGDAVLQASGNWYGSFVQPGTEYALEPGVGIVFYWNIQSLFNLYLPPTNQGFGRRTVDVIGWMLGNGTINIYAANGEVILKPSSGGFDSYPAPIPSLGSRVSTYNSGYVNWRFRCISGAWVLEPRDCFSAEGPGLVPASGGGTANFMRADGAWANPQGDYLLLADGSDAYPDPGTTNIYYTEITQITLLSLPDVPNGTIIRVTILYRNNGYLRIKAATPTYFFNTIDNTSSQNSNWVDVEAGGPSSSPVLLECRKTGGSWIVGGLGGIS